MFVKHPVIKITKKVNEKTIKIFPEKGIYANFVI